MFLLTLWSFLISQSLYFFPLLLISAFPCLSLLCPSPLSVFPLFFIPSPPCLSRLSYLYFFHLLPRMFPFLPCFLHVLTFCLWLSRLHLVIEEHFLLIRHSFIHLLPDNNGTNRNMWFFIIKYPTICKIGSSHPFVMSQEALIRYVVVLPTAKLDLTLCGYTQLSSTLSSLLKEGISI